MTTHLSNLQNITRLSSVGFQVLENNKMSTILLISNNYQEENKILNTHY